MSSSVPHQICWAPKLRVLRVQDTVRVLPEAEWGDGSSFFCVFFDPKA